MPDRIHETLSTLRTDTERTPLADASAVRHRGNQRTRRQAIGTSLAVVALVAGVIGVSGALTGTDTADNLPADPTTSQPPAPTVETREAIGPELLLRPEQLPTFPNQPFSVGETLDRASATDTVQRFLTVCGTAPSSLHVPDSAVLRTFVTDLDVTMWQWVAQYATIAEAGTEIAALTSACRDGGATPVDIADPATMPGVHNAFRAAVFSADPGSEFNGDVVGVLRTGDTVVVLGLRGMLRESDVDLDAFDAAVASAAQSLTIL